MVDHFCLKWNNFHNSIVSVFESLQSSEDLVDVTLMCEGRNVKAHKVILSACSPYFRNLFKETPCQHPIIILKDVLHCDLIAILQFMYKGEVLVTQEGLTSFLKTAELLQVSGLAGNTAHVPEPPIVPTQSIIASPQTHIPARPSPPASPKTILNRQATDVTLTKHTDKETVSNDAVKPDNEPMQSCSYPHEDLHIKTESEDVEFQELEFANVSEDNVEELTPATDESILKRSLKAQEMADDAIMHCLLEYGEQRCPLGTLDCPGTVFETTIFRKDRKRTYQRICCSKCISPQSTKLYTMDPKIDLSKNLRVAPSVLVKNNANLTGKELSKRKSRASPDTVATLAKRTLSKIESKKSKIESSKSDAPQSKTEPASHGSQCGKCPHCHKVYSNQSALKYHVRLVHSDMLNMFCCHLCPESFEYREGYKAHMWDIHNVRN